MAFSIQHPNEFDKAAPPVPIEPEKAALVHEELDRICASKFFKNALRSRQFLEYVVRHRLEGQTEKLKERTIGTEVFQRDPGYATGDDPVVRVQASEVRRRLEQYYQSLPSHPAVRIELQPGSYSPNIHWASEEDLVAETTQHASTDQAQRSRIHPVSILLFSISLVLVLVAGYIYHRSRTTQNPVSTTITDKFWAPVFTTQQPVLICLAKPVVYRPSYDLYQHYAETHPGTFQYEVERSNNVIPFDANEKVRWGDIIPYDDYGVAVGDAYAAVRVSSILGRIGKPSQVRIGQHYSFEDLSNSPSVIVGAFNNKWTMQLMPGLHFQFVEDRNQYAILEQTPGGRAWRATINEEHQSGVDYAIVARLLDSKTGQFMIVAAGIQGSGTQAAGEFISNPDFLERGMYAIPPDWQKKNLELVLKSAVTDSVSGPPQVVAYYIW